jgi:hypothetical protein
MFLDSKIGKIAAFNAACTVPLLPSKTWAVTSISSISKTFHATCKTKPDATYTLNGMNKTFDRKTIKSTSPE